MGAVQPLLGQAKIESTFDLWDDADGVRPATGRVRVSLRLGAMIGHFELPLD
jgi:hypothetical protein